MLRCDSNGFRYGNVESSWWNERSLQTRQHFDANETEKEYVESVVRSESCLEGEASAPLYRRVLGIPCPGYATCDRGQLEDTCRVILVQGRVSVWHGAFKLAYSLKCGTLKRCKFIPRVIDLLTDLKNKSSMIFTIHSNLT